MKTTLLLLGLAALMLPACSSFSRRDEVAVEVPSHDRVVKDEIPAEGGRKIPVVEQY